MLLLSHMGYSCCEECMLLWITARMLKKETFNQFLILFFFQNVCSIALNDDSRCIMYNFLWCPFFLRCISFIIFTIYNLYKLLYTIHVVPDNKTWFRSQTYTITRHFPIHRHSRKTSILFKLIIYNDVHFIRICFYHHKTLRIFQIMFYIYG